MYLLLRNQFYKNGYSVDRKASRTIRNPSGTSKLYVAYDDAPRFAEIKKLCNFFFSYCAQRKQKLFGIPSLPTYNEATASGFLRYQYGERQKWHFKKLEI